MEWFEKGVEDIELTPTLTVDGDAFDTDPLTEIVIKVFWHKTFEPLWTYTLTGGDITKEAPTTDGQLRFVVSSGTTASGRTGEYFYQIHTYEPDIDFPGGQRERSFTGWVFGLKHSV